MLEKVAALGRKRNFFSSFNVGRSGRAKVFLPRSILKSIRPSWQSLKYIMRRISEKSSRAHEFNHFCFCGISAGYRIIGPSPSSCYPPWGGKLNHPLDKCINWVMLCKYSHNISLRKVTSWELLSCFNEIAGILNCYIDSWLINVFTSSSSSLIH
jgi:hypothetical protein